MIGETISNHGTSNQLFNLHSSWFDSIDGGDNGRLPNDKPPSPATTERAKPIFDETGYGVDTCEPAEIAHKQNSTKKKPKSTKPNNNKVLDEYTTTTRRIELLTRPYEPSDFDKAPRPQWIPKASNDNHKRKHSFPALDEARNNQLIIGRNRADTLVQNEWAFDILLEVRDLMDAAAPASAWLEHNAHGAADEHDVGDDSNPGYGVDIKHDYGPSVNKVKRLWEFGNDNRPSKDGEAWNPGTVELMDVVSEPTKRVVKALRKVGGLENNEFNQVTHFRDNKGNWLKFKTKTRGPKGKRVFPKVIPDPKDSCGYNSAALPRNKKGELVVGFFAGKTGSSKSSKPDTLDFEPAEGPSNSFSDPWAATIAAEKAREESIITLGQHRLLVGDKPYEALTQAASGFRIGELCGGRLGNTTDSARNRNLLQVAIARIMEDRTRTQERAKIAA
jgi:hypothetical protein